MGITLPAFTPMEDSLFLTLCARALDNRSQHPVLADATADEIVRTLDYDYGKFHINTNLMINVALRAKKLDEVAAGFVARHRDAVGLDFGAGLDTRMIRITPPSTVEWYDVDFPAVIAARKRLVPDRANAHGIGADLTPEAGWTPSLVTDRPSSSQTA
jgi:O-methyltransferase involved in polyketide biosynthesis